MTHEEFFERVPFWLGCAQASMRGHVCAEHQKEMRFLALQMFWVAPRYFALVELARRHPEEFAELATKQERNAAERYGAKGDWAEEEPKREQHNGNPATTSD